MRLSLNHHFVFTAIGFLWLLALPNGPGAVNAADISDDALNLTHQTIPSNGQSAPFATQNSDEVSPSESASFYPAPLLQKLGIDSSDVIKNQSQFRNNRIHIEWMNHVHSAIPEISNDKEEAIVRIHTSLLYFKDRLDKAYFSGKINKQEFTTQLAALMKWFQEANRSVLSKKEFSSLFEVPLPDDESAPAQSSGGELGFPIPNPETTASMIKESFDDTTIRKIARFYQEHAQELRDIKKIYETESFPDVKADQVKNDMLRIEKELQAHFMSYCQDILSDEQFQLLFENRAEE